MPLNNSLSFRRRSYTVESSHTTPVEQQEVITEKQQKIPYKTISVNKEYSNSFHLDNQFTIEKAINNLEHELSLEMEKYQQLKNESKKHCMYFFLV